MSNGRQSAITLFGIGGPCLVSIGGPSFAVIAVTIIVGAGGDVETPAPPTDRGASVQPHDAETERPATFDYREIASALDVETPSGTPGENSRQSIDSVPTQPSDHAAIASKANSAASHAEAPVVQNAPAPPSLDDPSHPVDPIYVHVDQSRFVGLHSEFSDHGHGCTVSPMHTSDGVLWQYRCASCGKLLHISDTPRDRVSHRTSRRY